MKITRLLAPILAFVFVLSMPISATATEVKVIALFANKAMLKVGDQQGVVKVGETFGGVLLKSATGRGAVVEIDGEEVKLGLNQSIAGNYKKPERQKLKIYPTKSGMYFVDGEINGAATRFLVGRHRCDFCHFKWRQSQRTRYRFSQRKAKLRKNSGGGRPHLASEVKIG